MRRIARLFLAAALFALAPVAAQAQTTQVNCQSRNFQHQFCPVNGDVTRAFLISQISRSACIQGQSWGWNRSGVWVSNGCNGMFGVDAFRPPPPPPNFGDRMSCDSRNFQHEFCASGARLQSVQLVNQRSRSPCTLGRTWGWRGEGIWVSDGCQADFRVQTSFQPIPPPRPGLTFCESREFRYQFCDTGPIRGAQLVQQTSNTACRQGRNWGWQRNGIWVDNGCSATFRVTR